MKNAKVFIALMMLFAMSVTVEAKKVQLEYNLEKGSSVLFEITTLQEISQEIMGESQEQRLESTQKFKVIVHDILDNGDYVMHYRVVDYKMDGSSAMGDISFDMVDSQASGPFGEALDLLVSTPIEFVMKKSGEIVEVIENEEFAKKVEELMDPTNPEYPMLAPLMSQYGSEDGAKQAVHSILLEYPEGKVKTGKPWQTTASLNQMVEFVSTIDTQVKEIKGETAILTQDTKIEIGENGSTMEMQGMEMEYELSGGKKGSFEIDMATGMIQSAEGITTITGIISVDSPQLPAPMSIPMTIKTTDTIKRVVD